MNELPLYMNDQFGHQVGLVLAVLIGTAFGFVLERAGFGKATVLAAQFYFKDMRVLKVMFTAIVTALLGMTILSGIGVLDIGAIYVPPTFVWPQLVGGLLLGAGFIISGYCPGTGVVALASGKIDGLFAIFGVMLGSVLFGLGFPLYETFYSSGDLGVLRFPDLLGIPQPVLAVGVTVMALGMFFGGEILERKFTSRTAESSAYLRIRRPVFLSLLVVSAVGLATLVAPSSGPAVAVVVAESGTITAVELAKRLIEDPFGLYLVDTRAVGSDGKIAGTLPVSDEQAPLRFVENLPATRDLVAYGAGAGGVAELPPSIFRFAGKVLILEGGYDEFARQILSEPILVEDPSSSDIAEFRLLSALHAHFTGSVIQAAPPPAPRATVRKGGKKEGGC